MIRLFGLLVVAAASVFCQSTATLQGSVKDAQGNAVQGAAVRLFRQDSAAADRAISGDDGAFTLNRLSADTAILQVDKQGFRTSATTIDLKLNETAKFDIVLDVAGVSDSVLVTAAGVPQKLDEISKAVSVVSTEELKNRNEYSLSDVLRTVPGLIVTNGGGPGQNTSMRIRGLRADAAAVLVDGLRFRDASTTQGDSSSFLSALNIVSPDHVEILRGSGSSLYGTNAVGGVVNVVSQEGGGPLRGDLQAEGGSLGLMRGRATLSGGAFQDRLKFAGGLMHLNVMNGVDGNDANRSTGAQGFVRYDFTPKINLSGRLWGSDDFVQLNNSPTTTGMPASNFPSDGIIPAIPLSPANVQIINAGGIPDYSGVTYVPGRDDTDNRRSSRFYTTALIYRQMFTPTASWQTSYQRVHTSRVFQNGPGGGGFQPAAPNYSNYVGDIDTADVRGMIYFTPAISLTGGYEFERETYFDTQDNNLPPPRSISERTNIRQTSNTGYFAAQMGFFDRRLQVSLSGRLQAYQLSRPVFDYAGAQNPYDSASIPRPKTALTGDASVAYLIPRTNTKLRGHFGNAYRAPSLYERFGAGFSNNPVTGVTVFTPYGDPRLLPDRYNSVDGGIDQYLFNNRVRASATYFYTRVVSITAFDSSGVVQPSTDPYGRSSGYINGSGGIARGAELSVETRPLKTLSLTGSYTYLRENTDRDISVADFWKILQVPAHTMSFLATKYWGSRLDTTFYLTHYSTYYSSFFAVTRSRAFEFPAFTKGSLIGSYRLWQSEKSALRIYAKGDNIFNQRYYQNGWLAAGATVIAGMGFSY